MELRCEWNLSTCFLFTHTWLSSTYLNHHLGGGGGGGGGGLRADERALSSTCSMTRLAKMALTGEPIGQPKICWKWLPWENKEIVFGDEI